MNIATQKALQFSKTGTGTYFVAWQIVYRASRSAELYNDCLSVFKHTS